MICPTTYSLSRVRVLNKGGYSNRHGTLKVPFFCLSLRYSNPQNSRFFTFLLLFCCGTILYNAVSYWSTINYKEYAIFAL